MPFEPVSTEDMFTCRRCGDCCRGYGGTFVSPREVNAIAAYLQVDIEFFMAAYCQLSGNKPILRQGRDGYCIFWDGLCRIHPVKPRMCKAWPFIDSILVDIQNWHAMAAVCPGMRTDVPASAVRAAVRSKLAEHQQNRPPFNEQPPPTA